MTQTPAQPLEQVADDSYPQEWLTPEQRRAVAVSRGIDADLDALSEDQLLDALNRTLAKRRK